MIQLEPSERLVWKTGRMLQSELPRTQGLCLRQLVAHTGLSMGWVAKWVAELEAKGMATSRKIGSRRKKGTTRFLAPRKSN